MSGRGQIQVCIPYEPIQKFPKAPVELVETIELVETTELVETIEPVETSAGSRQARTAEQFSDRS